MTPQKLMVLAESPRDLPTHVPALDGIRGLAVLIVIASHLNVLLRYQAVTPWNNLNRLLLGGFLGVDIFFVLSGFLITSLLLMERSNNSRISLSRFYARRALRLLPALYLLLVVDTAIAVFEKQSFSGQWNETWTSLLYLNNWYYVWPWLRHGSVNFESNLGHLWSLAVEEQFYLLWPMVLMLLLKFRRPKVFAPVLITLFIGAIILRRTVLWHNNVNWIVILIRTDARLDSLLIGALLALFYRHVIVHKTALKLTAYAALPIFIVTAYQGPSNSFLYTSGFTLVAVAILVMILASVEQAWSVSRVLEQSWLRFIGRISYGLYLWHYVVFTFLSKHFFVGPRVFRIFVGLSTTMAITMMSWYLVEQPALRFKNRRFQKSS
jgi:peptidoglycan/LPS O-acetylase OafA/YrhL